MRWSLRNAAAAILLGCFAFSYAPAAADAGPTATQSEVPIAERLRELLLAGEDPAAVAQAAAVAMKRLASEPASPANAGRRIDIGLVWIDALIRQRNPREGIALARELETLALIAQDPDRSAMVRDRHVKIMIYAGEEPAALDLLSQWRAAGSEDDRPYDVGKGATISLALSEIALLAQRGDPAGALPLNAGLIARLEELVPQADGEARRDAIYALASQYETRGALMLMLGRTEDAFPELARAAELYAGIPGVRPATFINLATTRAAALQLAGRRAEAREVLRDILSARAQDLPAGGIYGFRLRTSLFSLEIQTGDMQAALATGEAAIKDARILAVDALAAGTEMGVEERVISANLQFHAALLAARCPDCAGAGELSFAALRELLGARALAASIVTAAPAANKREVHASLLQTASAAGLAAQLAPGDLAAYRGNFGSDEALLTVVSGPEQTVVQLLRRGALVSRVVPVTQVELCETVQAMRIDLGDTAPLSCRFDVRGRPFRDLSTSLSGSPDAARLLHEWLIAPFDAELAQVAMLHVAPLDSAAALPWAALRDADGEYLVERMAIDFLPALAADPGAGPPPAATYLGVGAPCIGAMLEDCGVTADMAARTPVLRGSLPVSGEGDLRQSLFLDSLPFSAREIARTSDLFGTRGARLTGPQAQRETVLSQLADTPPSVLHFATHGLSAGEFGLVEPALVLSPLRDAQGEPEPTLLLASELARLWLPADLVILSACATGREDAEDATGTVSGFIRALMQAGSRNLLASHGAVPDESMGDFVVDVVARWRGKAGRRALAEALREASLARIATRRTTDGEAWPMVLAAHLQ
jgi:CHAT domain-containing protein/tetratricopeptide (TPR) repeat protein